jgi:hypothetical protein
MNTLDLLEELLVASKYTKLDMKEAVITTRVRYPNLKKGHFFRNKGWMGEHIEIKTFNHHRVEFHPKQDGKVELQRKGNRATINLNDPDSLEKIRRHLNF